MTFEEKSILQQISEHKCDISNFDILNMKFIILFNINVKNPKEVKCLNLKIKFNNNF